MRRFIAGLCALASIALIDAAAVAVDGPVKLAAEARLGRAETTHTNHTVACLGGLLNDESSGGYLTVADYPRYAPPAVGRHAFICGDAIPPFIAGSDRNGAGRHER